MEHWGKYAKSVISDGSRKLTKKIFNGVKGHFTNDFEQAVEVWMTSTHEGLMSSMVRMENEALQNRLRGFRNGREICLNHGIQVVNFITQLVGKPGLLAVLVITAVLYLIYLSAKTIEIIRNMFRLNLLKKVN